MNWRTSLASALLLAAVERVGAAPPHIITRPADAEFAGEAAALAKRGYNFEQLFAVLCQTVLSNTQATGKVRLDDQVRAMFGGLWLWTRQGGSPTFQGQHDKALHFIGGGAFEGYWDAGRSAAVRKEEMDRQDPNNFFDLDDLAATLMGARWVDLAANGVPGARRRWVELWATGAYTLSRSLPKLQFGHLPPGQDAPPEKIEAVAAAVRAAMKLPASAD